jgi:hypothetical protein
MRKIHVYQADEGTGYAVIVDDQMMTSLTLGTPDLIVDDTQENRDKYGLTEDNAPKVVNVLKSSQ